MKDLTTKLLTVAAAATLWVACSDNVTVEALPEDELVADTADTEVVVEEEFVPTVWNEKLTALHTDGKYLMTINNEVTNLHGFAQTYQPYYNENAWTDYDYDACLAYNKGKIDEIVAAGWKMTFVRQHMDPYWCAGLTEDLCWQNINWEDFDEALENLYIPMAKYAAENGMYVLMRPPGVSPEEITINDGYQHYLEEVWHRVASHPSLRNNPAVMFELANEPVNVEGMDGSMGGDKLTNFQAMAEFLQPIVDTIRCTGAENVLWLPGLGYQSWFYGFSTYPIEGENLGWAVHCYPGWYGSDALADSGEGLYDGTNGGYASFQAGWNEHFGATLDMHPLIVTEMDWSNGDIYPGYTWGQGQTGTAGGAGFGANFKYIADNCGNVSYLIFTGQEHLAKVDDNDPIDGVSTFYNDLENSCVRTAYQWYKDYYEGAEGSTSTVVGLTAYIDGVEYNEGDTVTLKTGNSSYMALYATRLDGTYSVLSVNAGFDAASSDLSVFTCTDGQTLTATGDGYATLNILYNGVVLNIVVQVSSFPWEKFDTSWWGDNTFNQETKRLVTSAYGCCGWYYSDGLDVSGYKYLVIEFCRGTNVTGGAEIHIYDKESYWTDCYSTSLNMYRKVINLQKATINGEALDLEHIYRIGFLTGGGTDNQVIFNQIYLTNTQPTDSYTPPAEPTSDLTDDSADEEEEEQAEEQQDEQTEVDHTSDRVFAMTDTEFNPSIWGENSMRNNVLTTEAYGFGGWWFSQAQDFVGSYRYLVVKVTDQTPLDGSVFFRMFDQDTYFSTCANWRIYDTTTVIDLQNQNVNDDFGEGYQAIDATSVWGMGFFTWGCTVYFDELYLTNTKPE